MAGAADDAPLRPDRLPAVQPEQRQRAAVVLAGGEHKVQRQQRTAAGHGRERGDPLAPADERRARFHALPKRVVEYRYVSEASGGGVGVVAHRYHRRRVGGADD